MKLIFTRSKLPLSRFIRWGLREPVSHFAVVFDEKFAIHSNLFGVSLNWFSTFKKHAEVVYEIDVPLQLKAEEEVYRSLLDNFDHKPYDFGAFFYFVWRAFLWRFFDVPMPKRSPWATDGFLCTEIAIVLPDWLLPKDKIEDLSILSPYKLYLILSEVIGTKP